MNCIDDDEVYLNVQSSVNSKRVRKLVQQGISGEMYMRRVHRRSMRRFGLAAASVVIVLALSTTALAMAGVLDFGAFYDSFFKNPEVTGAITPDVSDKSVGIGITLTNAYTDGLTTHLTLQLTGLADTKFDSIQFRTDPMTGYTIFNRDGFTFTDGILTVPASIFLSGTEAEKTGHVALVITGIALYSNAENDSYTVNDISGNWDLSFDIKLPDADKTHMTFKARAENSDYIDEITFDIRPATVEIIFTSKGGNQDLDAFTKYFRSYPEPVLTLDDGSVVKFKDSGSSMIDSTMGSWSVNTEYFDISKLKSITFCGQTYDVELR
jgi:hypothetical protein